MLSTGTFDNRVCVYVLAFSLSVSKKLAPIPPKVPFGQPAAVTDLSAGQPSPLSLSPTPPSTPSPYGLSYPQGYSLASGQLSPAAAAPPLTSPAGFATAAAKSRPTPKPRQRPTLPPPQPPTVSLPGPSPQSTEHPVLDGTAPGESMSTGNRAAAPARFLSHLGRLRPVQGSLVPLSLTSCAGPGELPPRAQWIQIVPQMRFLGDCSPQNACPCGVLILSESGGLGLSPESFVDGASGQGGSPTGIQTGWCRHR